MFTSSKRRRVFPEAESLRLRISNLTDVIRERQDIGTTSVLINFLVYRKLSFCLPLTAPKCFTMNQVMENYRCHSENKVFRFWRLYLDNNGELDSFTEILGSSPLYSIVKNDESVLWILGMKVSGSLDPFESDFLNQTLDIRSVNQVLASISHHRREIESESKEKEVRIKRILAHSGSDKRDFEFLVYWEGYSVKESTWEPFSSLRDTQALENYVTNSAPQLRHILKEYHDIISAE